MKKNAVYASSLCALAALLAFAACHKSSSSSSSGSLTGAMGGLANLTSGMGGLSVKGMRTASTCPSGACPCPGGGNITLSGTIGSATFTCITPNQYTAFVSGLSGQITETANSCINGGYTYNGSLTAKTPGSLVNALPTDGTANFEICKSSANPNDEDTTGSFGLSGTVSVTGNGVNISSCAINIDTYVNASVLNGGSATQSGAVSWSVSGGNCTGSNGGSGTATF